MFEVGLSDDACITVRATEGMGRLVLIDTEDTESSFCESVECGGTDAADT